jgi:hypothetical protein
MSRPDIEKLRADYTFEAPPDAEVSEEVLDVLALLDYVEHLERSVKHWSSEALEQKKRCDVALGQASEMNVRWEAKCVEKAEMVDLYRKARKGMDDACAEVDRVTEQYKDDVVRHAGELKEAYLSEKEAWSQASIVKSAALERTPDGTQLCYLFNGVLVLLGDPGPEEDDSSPDYHSCDSMGCGTFSHVKQRRQLTAEQMERLCRGQCVGLSEDGEP